jgi:cell division protein FtsW
VSARTDVADKRPPPFPELGLRQGWEPAVVAAATLLLVSVGLVTVYSASAFLAQREARPDTFYVLRQTAGAAAGLVLLLACSRIPYRWWRIAAWPAVLVSFVLLMLLVLPATTELAPEINGARRWLDLGVTFQPSELAKLAIVIWTAHTAVRKRHHFRSLSRGFLPFLLVWTALLMPILLQPDLSTAFVAGVAGAIVLFAAGGRVAHFLFLGALLAPIAIGQLDQDFRQDRLLAFQDVEEHASAEGYQVHQSLIAIGSGGINGVGFGEGRQKFGFLPEPHNDFIFAMIGEEWGLLGVTFVLGLYLSLILVGFRIAGRARDGFGQLLAIGITSTIALHAMLHMGVGLGLVPPTGLSLPLVSYGRSNLLATLASAGILISVARGQGEAPALARGRGE